MRVFIKKCVWTVVAASVGFVGGFVVRGTSESKADAQSPSVFDPSIPEASAVGFSRLEDFPDLDQDQKAAAGVILMEAVYLNYQSLRITSVSKTIQSKVMPNMVAVLVETTQQQKNDKYPRRTKKYKRVENHLVVGDGDEQDFHGGHGF